MFPTRVLFYSLPFVVVRSSYMFNLLPLFLLCGLQLNKFISRPFFGEQVQATIIMHDFESIRTETPQWVIYKQVMMLFKNHLPLLVYVLARLSHSPTQTH